MLAHNQVHVCAPRPQLGWRQGIRRLGSTLEDLPIGVGDRVVVTLTTHGRSTDSRPRRIRGNIQKVKNVRERNAQPAL
jgi:hypothetical protein